MDNRPTKKTVSVYTPYSDWIFINNFYCESLKHFINWIREKNHSVQFPFLSDVVGLFLYLLVPAFLFLWAAATKSLQSSPTLCDPMDGSPLGSPVPGILQARTLEWVAISFSNAWKWKVKVKSLNRVRLLATPLTVAYQAPLSIGFSRQEYWNGVPLPSLFVS